jgi:hypothetical protein
VFTVTTNNIADVYISSLTSEAIEYEVSGSTCPKSPEILAMAAKCTFVANFIPTNSGLKSAAITVNFRLSPTGKLFAASANVLGTGRSPIVFAGLQSISDITGRSVHLNWNPASDGVAYYQIFAVADSGAATFVSSVLSPNTSATVGDLSPDTAYKFRVRAFDVMGAGDNNTHDVTVNTLPNVPPEITSVSPNHGPKAGGGILNISGKSFRTGATVKVGNANCPTTVITAESVFCTLPAKNAGVYAVVVTNTDGQAVTLEEAYAFEVQFAGITSISLVKGTSMQLNWVGSIDAVSYLVYSIGGDGNPTYKSSVIAPATSAVVTGLTPNTLYRWRVRASDQNGAFDPNLIAVSAMTLGSPPPAVGSVSPIFGSVLGGTALTIDGTSFVAGATVKIKDLSCTSVVVVSSTRITCISPAGPGGSQTVTVTNGDSQSGILASGFSYVVPFAGLGNIDAVTGVSVQLNWTAIPEAASYQIYSAPTVGAPQFIKAVASPASSTTVTGLIPNTLYYFRVRAFDAAGFNDGNNGDVMVTTLAFAPPVVAGVSPQSGLLSGGEGLTISGTGFSPGAAVLIGTSPCGSITVVSSTAITCTTPAKTAGTYGITITNVDGQFGTLADAYNYVVPFDGLQTISQVTGVSMRLNWGLSAAAASYQIYAVDNSGNATFNRSVASPAVNVVISGLTPNTTYKWRARAYDAAGASESNMNDVSATTMANGPPQIGSLGPISSGLSGGATLILSGSGFMVGAAVLVGGSPCTGLVRTNATELTCTLPPRAAGAHEVQVANPDGQSATFSPGVTYHVTFGGLASISQITGSSMRLNWTESPDAASYQVYQIAGNGTAVFFTSIAAPASQGTVTGLVALTSHTWRVRAFDATGSSDANTIDQTASTIAAQPTIASFSPIQGAKSGGGTLTINGSQFLAGATITVAGQACGSVVVSSAIQAVCVPPAHSAGNAELILTNPDGQSVTAATPYKYVVSFNGLATISNVSGTGMRLNWSASPDAASYQVYSVNGSGQTSYHSTLVASATFATITGLVPNTAYNWRVRAVDQDGALDANTADVSATTLSSAPPTISSVSPTSGTVSGGTVLTVHGTGFLAGMTLSLSGTPCPSVTISSLIQATCVTPTKAGGIYDLTATNLDGQVGTLTGGYSYIVPFAGLATINQVTGISARLNWTGISEATSYQVYGIDGSGQATFLMSVPAPAANVTVTGLTPNTLYRFRVRAFDVGGYNDGNSGMVTTTTLANPPPTVTGISPGSGLVTGAESVTISGTGFLAAATVKIGANTCTSPSVLSTTAISCTTPANSAGTYSITVTNADGQGSTLASAFAYTIPFSGLQSIDNVSGVAMRLNWGVSAAAVSYQVYSVDAGGTPTFHHTTAAPAVTTTITGLIPGISYKWRVRAFDSQGNTDVNTVDVTAMTLANAPPTIASVAPTTSTIAAGGALTVNGSGFLAGISVTIGGNPCTSPTVINVFQLTCTIPGGSAGAKDIVVTNSDGQSATRTAGLTYYISFGGLTSISNISGTTMRLNWSASPDAASYQIYQVSGGGSSLSYRTSIATPATQVTLTGLTPLTSYTWRVRAFDASGAYDTNSIDVSATTINAPPVVTSFTPASGPKSGAGTLTINGSGFTAGAAVAVGGSACTSPVVVNSTQMTCTLPARTAGPASVVVTNSDSQASTAATSYQYLITFGGLTSIGSISGNTMNLAWTPTSDAASYYAYSVDGGGNATYVTATSAPATNLTVTGLTANTTYKWRVRAYDADGASDFNTTDLTAATLTFAPPTVGGISPATVSSHLGGSQSVTVSGTGFRSGATVSIGGSPCTSVSILSAASLTCTVPALAIGSYAVAVANSDSQSASLNGGFSYFISFSGLSSITSIAGNRMTLNWASSADAVSYYVYKIVNGSPIYVATVSHPTLTYIATGLSINTSYQWRVRAADANGDQDANTNDMVSSTLPNLPPSLTSVAPGAGPLVGGTTVTLTGGGFLAGATVTIGASTCGSVNVSSATTITCTLPAKAAGSYGVTVTNTDGQASISSEIYAYQPAPTIISVDPDFGSYAGGTAVAVHGSGFVAGATISIGGATCTGPTLITGTEMTCTTGAYTTNVIRKMVGATITNADGQSGSQADVFRYTVNDLAFVAGQPTSNGCTDGNGTPGSVRFGGILTGMYSDGTYLYVSDSSNYMIRRFKYSDNSVQLVAGRRCISGSADGILGTATMTTPYGLTVLGGYLYFADLGRHTIRRVDISATSTFGTITTVAGINGTAGYLDANGTAAKFSSPRGLTTDGTYLYVADGGNHNIRKIDPASSFAVTTFAGSNIATPVAGSADGVSTAATFNSPRGIAFYQDSTSAAPAITNYLLVVTAVDHRVRAIRISDRNVTTPAGTTQGWADANNVAARFDGPQDIAITGAFAYVSDYTRHMMRKIDLTNFSTFAVSTVAGLNSVSNWLDGANGINRLATPYATAINGNKVYFGDASSTIRYIDTASSNNVGTWIGTNQQQKPAQASNGMATEARFQKSLYGDLASDGTYLYVADYTNHLIRKIDPSITYAPKTFTVSLGAPGVVTSANHGYAQNTPVVLTTTGSLPTGLTAVTATYFIKNPTTNTFELGTSPSSASINTSVSQSGIHTIYRPSVTNLSGSGTAGGANGNSISTATHSSPAGLAYDSSTNILYCSDYGGHVVRAIDLTSGFTTTIAGLYATIGYNDNPVGTNARFNGPMALDIDTSVTPHVLYVGEWTGGNHIKRIDLTGTYAVTTLVGAVGVAGTNASLDGFGAAAQVSGVQDLEVASYMLAGVPTKKILFANNGAHTLRSYDVNSTYVETITTAGQGYQDTVIPSGSQIETQAVKFDTIRSLYWDGTHLLIADSLNDLVRWYDPTTGTVGTLLNGYYNQGRLYANAFAHYDSMDNATITGGTAVVYAPTGLTFWPGMGYIIASQYGIWRLR